MESEGSVWKNNPDNPASDGNAATNGQPIIKPADNVSSRRSTLEVMPLKPALCPSSGGDAGASSDRYRTGREEKNKENNVGGLRGIPASVLLWPPRSLASTISGSVLKGTALLPGGISSATSGGVISGDECDAEHGTAASGRGEDEPCSRNVRRGRKRSDSVGLPVKTAGTSSRRNRSRSASYGGHDSAPKEPRQVITLLRRQVFR